MAKTRQIDWRGSLAVHRVQTHRVGVERPSREWLVSARCGFRLHDKQKQGESYRLRTVRALDVHDELTFGLGKYTVTSQFCYPRSGSRQRKYAYQNLKFGTAGAR